MIMDSPDLSLLLKIRQEAIAVDVIVGDMVSTVRSLRRGT